VQSFRGRVAESATATWWSSWGDWSALVRRDFARDPAQAWTTVCDLHGDFHTYVVRQWREWGCERYELDEDAPIPDEFYDEVDPYGQRGAPRELLRRLVWAEPHRARPMVRLVLRVETPDQQASPHAESRYWRGLIARARRVRHRARVHRSPSRATARRRERRARRRRGTAGGSRSPGDGPEPEPPEHDGVGRPDAGLSACAASRRKGAAL
jgi:hypothetical protein